MGHHVIEGDGVDDTVVLQIVLVGDVVAVPGHHVKGRVILMSHEQMSLVFGDNLEVWNIPVFVASHRNLEVPGIGQTIGSC